ncbi:SusC/RagA family TonB-linked outer membrane protein [Panacibacter ginsenosidivorans]|uniref:SusC/RagA family TonB-linked outer membrane protein n=1 Tax=Panacibacter ginsenosidivorans TaxID=1813871 RepID=A0A5B8VD51_9BACT|nr:SusC/RagA family TonB-linked outer membrane protein [Panacibacter ginsenosidivorans]QEC68198.1 SusC/RagA family TonB-linked outer membrane protein [Panacibacter ginsenosidivorans]
MRIKLLLKGVFISVLLFTFASTGIFAQSKKVSGKILNASTGIAVEGASILVKGTSIGTTSNKDGVFVITMPNGSSVLVVSVIGYETQEVNVSNKSEVEIKINESIDKLTDVVVVGYGTQKKKEITSAITSVTAEQFNKGNINDVAQLLQGKVAGLSIARPGGDPNGGFEIRLRGLSTLGAGTSPLVVIDGQVGADLNSIDPNDIQSIDVLKDGSSAAIYGTRGSAGVIIVTTKTGKRGTSQVNYNGSVSVETAARLTKHMSADEYRALIKNLGAGTDYGFNTDWYDEITRPALSHQHNLSFSGGNDHTTYNASLNYRNAEGIAITTGFKQLNGRLNITHKALNDRLVFNVEFGATRKIADLGFSNAFEYAVIYNPTSPVYAQTPDQDLAGGGYFEVSATEYSNPVAMLQQNTNEQTLKRLNFAGSAEYEILKGLKFLVRYAQQSTSTYLTAYSPSDAFIDRGFYNGVTGVGRHGYSYKSDNEALTQLYENTLSYQRKISNLEISSIAGYSYQDFIYQGFNAGGGNFITDLSGQDFSTAQDFQNGLGSVGSYKNGNRLVAFFGRVNLNYNNIAFLSASLRREGSSEFGPNNKWGYFPAVSAGVDLNKLISVPGFSTLKLRGSYGVTGALPPFSGLSELTFNGRGNYLINGAWIATYGPNQNENPDLKWEKKAEIDIGLDFAAFNSRLTGTIDYYNRKTSDLIFNVTVPSPPALFNRAWRNVGDLRGTGYEIALNYQVLKSGKLNWNTGINYSHNHVVLTRLDPSAGSYIGETNLGSPGQEATLITRSYEGAEIGAFYNAVYRGVDKDGKFLFDDGNGNAVLSGATTYKTVIGHGLPKFEMGWTNTFTYKNFDLNFFLRGSFGHDLINTERAFFENTNVASIYNVVNTKYFNPDLNDAQIFSSLFVEKGDFVKLDNATLGYNFNISKKGGMASVRSIRAFITGHNLFTITGYTGADPEVRYSDNLNGNILAPGIDRRSTWVLTRSFTLGVNIGL